MHLSSRVFAADPGRVPAVKAARADQRALCRRQNRGHQVVSILSPAVLQSLRFGHADERVRAERQFRPVQLARTACADGSSTKRACKATAPPRLGHGRPRREFRTSTILRKPACSRCSGTTASCTSMLAPVEDLTIQELARLVASVVYPGGRTRVRLEQARWGAEKAARVRRLHDLGWGQWIALANRIAHTCEWFLAHESAVLTA